MLEVRSSVLLVIDVQEKLFRAISAKEKMLDNLQRLIKGIKVLEIPIIVTEQYPKGLGPTVKEIASLLTGVKPIPKTSFSCCGDKAFSKEFERLNIGMVCRRVLNSFKGAFPTRCVGESEDIS